MPEIQHKTEKWATHHMHADVGKMRMDLKDWILYTATIQTLHRVRDLCVFFLQIMLETAVNVNRRRNLRGTL